MATRTISTKLALDGEAEYKAKLKNINAELALHKSELEKAQVQYKNNANSLEALSTKQAALKGQLEALDKRHSAQAEMLDKAREAQRKYAAQAEELRTKLAELQSSSADTAKEEEELAKKIAAAEESMQKAANSATSYQKQLNVTETDQLKLGDELKRTEQYLSEAESDFYKCAQSIDQYGNEVKTAGEAAEEFGDGTRNSTKGIEALASALAAAGVAKTVEEIAGALKECVDTFASFGAQMSTVQAISGASAFQMRELAEKAKYMGATTSFTATEAGQALEYMAMAGWKTDEMLGGLEGIMHLAAASGEDLAATSDIVTDALTAFGLSASDSGHFADVLAAASSNANTNVGMMGETFKYAAPVAGALGYSIEDTALAIGLMANAGIKGTQSGTALRSILSRLASNAGATKTQMGALEILTQKLGVEFYNMDGSTRALNEVLVESRVAWADLSEEEQISYGKIIAGQEAMSGWLALMNAGEGDLQKLSAAINTCNGSAKEMSEIKLDNFAGQMTLLESATDGLKLAIGEQLAPALTKLAKAGTDAFTWATDFVNDNPWVVGAAVGMTAAFVALTAGVAIYEKRVELAAAKTALLSAVMNANPAVFVVAGIIGLATAIGTYVASLDDADEKTKDFTDSLQDSKAAYEDTTASMKEQQASTRSVAASLQELLAVEEKSALQKDLIAQKVDQLNEAVPELGLYYDREKDSLVGLTEEELDSMLARAQAQEEYEATVARLNELSSEQAEIEARLTEARLALNEAEEAGAGNTRELQNNISELTSALEANAAEYAELTDASSNYAEQQAKSTLETETMTSTMDGLIAELEELEQSYMESYEAARESLSKQVALFKDLEVSADTSISDMISSMKGQVEYMETYADNIQKAMEKGVDQGLIKELSDGSEESAQILAKIVEGGEEDIQALNEEFARVQEGKDKFAATVADMEEDFSRKMTDIENRLKDAMEEMNQQEEAYRIGQNNITGLIQGTASQRQALINQYEQMGRDALAAYKREVGQASPSKKFREVGRFDIKGLVNGVEEEKKSLSAAYENAAREALSSMERHLPSTMEVPSTTAAFDRWTDAILSAVSSRDNGSQIPIYVDKLVVRDDSDVQRIARELYYLVQRENRSRGGGSL